MSHLPDNGKSGSRFLLSDQNMHFLLFVQEIFLLCLENLIPAVFFLLQYPA